MKKVIIKFIKLYQKFISPILGPTCRFHPSCSEYAVQALLQHGLVLGSFLFFKRLSRCHPWGGSGIDPVPKKR